MRRIVFVFVFYLVGVALSRHTIAQSLNNFDSLYNRAYSELTIESAQDALSGAMQAEQKAKAHHFLAWLYNNHNMYHEAANSYFSALELYTQLENVKQQTNVLEDIGIIYRIAGYYSIALDYYNRSLELSIQLEDTSGIADLHYNIGRVYRFNKDPSNAISSFERSLKIYEMLGSTKDIATAYNEIGLCYRDKANLNSARQYFGMALNFSSNDQVQIIKEINNIGETYILENNYQEAIDKLGEAVALMDSEGVDERDKALIFQNLGKVYDSIDTKDAVRFYEQSFALGVFDMTDVEYIELSGRLMQLLKESDPDKAFEYGENVLIAASGLMNLKAKLDQQNARYQVSASHFKSESEKRKVALQAQSEQNIIVNSIVSALVLAIVLGLFIGISRVVSKARSRKPRNEL